MKTYNVELDVSMTYRTSVEASSEKEAIKLAKREAYEDSWSCEATFNCVDSVIDVYED